MWMQSLEAFIDQSQDKREIKRAMPSARLRQRSQDVVFRIQS